MYLSVKFKKLPLLVPQGNETVFNNRLMRRRLGARCHAKAAALKQRNRRKATHHRLAPTLTRLVAFVSQKPSVAQLPGRFSRSRLRRSPKGSVTRYAVRLRVVRAYMTGPRLTSQLPLLARLPNCEPASGDE